jgi:hypothetical protein
MATGCGSIEVIPQFNSNNVQTVGCSNLPSEAVAGDTIQIDYTVENTNPAAADAVIEVFQQEGTGSRQSVGSTTEEISGNGTETGGFNVTLPSAGNFTFSVEVTSASRLTGL